MVFLNSTVFSFFRHSSSLSLSLHLQFLYPTNTSPNYSYFFISWLLISSAQLDLESIRLVRQQWCSQHFFVFSLISKQFQNRFSTHTKTNHFIQAGFKKSSDEGMSNQRTRSLTVGTWIIEWFSFVVAVKQSGLVTELSSCAHDKMLGQWWENKEIIESNACAHTPCRTI